MKKPRRKPRAGQPEEKTAAGPEALSFIPPLYPYGSGFPMAPPVPPLAGMSDLPDEIDEDLRDL